MSSKKADLLIKGGLVVSGQDISKKDVAVYQGKIEEIGPDLQGYDAKSTVVASKRYVLPGGIDSHAHPVYEDRMDSYSIAAAFGGITTVIAFVGNIKSWGFSGYTTDVVKAFIEESEAISYLDFGVHGTYAAADEDTIGRSISELITLGVPSFKVFMSYKQRGMMISDEALLTALEAASYEGGLTQVHAETGCCIEYLTERFVSSGKIKPEHFLPSQPNILEAEALNRAGTFAQVVGAPLYPVHLSTKESIPVIRRLRDQGVELFTETCPHYLTLTDEEILKKGPLAKVGPPLRKQEDSDALWEAVAKGMIDVIASDSGGFTVKRKMAGNAAENIFEAPYGLNTIEFMIPMMWNHGVNKGRITLPKLVKVFCENPAKIFGLYPRKGVLMEGSDADIVIWDPSRVHHVNGQHGNTDYSSFDGFDLLGMPDVVMQRGVVIIENEKLAARKPEGKFVKGDPNATPYAPHGYRL